MNHVWNLLFCNTNTCKSMDASNTHTHVPTALPSRQSDKVAYQNRKGRDEGEAMGLLFDNGFHQIPLLSQIKMPAWRALAIFLFICLLIFFSSPPPLSESAIGFLGQSIVTDLPHIQGEVNLNLIGHCLILPITDSSSRYWSQSCTPTLTPHLITTFCKGGGMFVCLCQSVWWKMWSLPHWMDHSREKGPDQNSFIFLFLFCGIPTAYCLCDRGGTEQNWTSLTPTYNLVSPGIKRSQEKPLKNRVTAFPVDPHPPPPVASYLLSCLLCCASQALLSPLYNYEEWE